MCACVSATGRIGFGLVGRCGFCPLNDGTLLNSICRVEGLFQK